MVQEYGFPPVRVQTILGSDFRPHFLHQYCRLVPTDAVPTKMIKKYGAKELYYRVKAPPTKILADDPARIIPAHVIPANPRKGTPERFIPDRHVPPSKEEINNMWTHEIFPSALL